MTIGKGTGWGRPGTLSPDSPTFTNDANLAAYVEKALHQNVAENRAENEAENEAENGAGSAMGNLVGPLTIPPIALTGGALWRTIGGPGAVGRYATAQAQHYPCDAVIAEVDGMTKVFVASLVARNRWWTDAAVVMNAQDMGAYRFGHRAHPGDALLDTYEAHVAFRDVAKIAKRAKLGSHLPHPGITERRVPTASFTFDRPRQLWLDERRVGNVEQLTVTVVPDAFFVVI
jgi:hypothetical protein